MAFVKATPENIKDLKVGSLIRVKNAAGKWRNRRVIYHTGSHITYLLDGMVILNLRKELTYLKVSHKA